LFGWTPWMYWRNSHSWDNRGTQKILGRLFGYAHAPFSWKFLMGFCSDGHMDPLNIYAKFEVCGLTLSWDRPNSDLSPGVARTPILLKGRPYGFGDGPVRWVPMGPPSSMVTYVRFLYLNTFQRYCRFCAPARHFSHPTSSLPKSPHVPLEYDECPTKSDGVFWLLGCTCPSNQFPRFPNYVFLIQQRHRQMEGRTDGQTYGHHTIAMPCYAL